MEDPIVDEEIEQNGSTSYTFDEAGTYDITCEIHPSMQITITVDDRDRTGDDSVHRSRPAGARRRPDHPHPDPRRLQSSAESSDPLARRRRERRRRRDGRDASRSRAAQFSPSVADDPGRHDGDLHRHRRPHGDRGHRWDAVDDPIVDEQGGADIEVTFDEAGTYNITCTIHPSMNMTITVEG